MTRRRIRATRPVDDRYTRGGLWEERTIASFLDDMRGARPDAPAVVDLDVTLSYSELGRRVDAVAAQLSALGVGRGDVVLVQLPNWWEAVVVFHAVASLGAAVNPVITVYRSAELRFILAQAGPAAVICAESFRGHDHVGMFAELIQELPEADRPALVTVRASRATPSTVDLRWSYDGPPVPRPDTDPGDIALLMYTSGTTSSPKGVLHSHRTLVYECRSIVALFGLGPDDAIFMGSPLTHVTGLLYGCILPAMLGSTVALLDVWDGATAADIVDEVGCTFTVAATPFLQTLTDEYERRGHPSALRTFACGGADVPAPLVRKATTTLRADVCRVYGSTEFPTFSCGRPSDDLHHKAETDGFPIGPVEGRLDDEHDGVGELLVSGPELFHGYLDATLNEESFTEDGFFRTGDLASFDDEGFVRIHGRKKDIIIRKGEKISAREVEDILYTHPKVADVAVIAVPDVESGERACAVVVPEVGEHLDLVELSAHLDEAGIAKQKYPEQLVLVGELPRTASGKVQKFVLREQVSGGSPRS